MLGGLTKAKITGHPGNVNFMLLPCRVGAELSTFVGDVGSMSGSVKARRIFAGDDIAVTRRLCAAGRRVVAWSIRSRRIRHWRGNYCCGQLAMLQRPIQQETGNADQDVGHPFDER